MNPVKTDFGKTLIKVKELFFDTELVKRSVSKTVLQKLNHIGGLIRKTARNSIRPRRSASKPGDPPNSHTGLLKDKLLYSFDKEAESVVVGPVLLNRGTDAPHTLEFGGYTQIGSAWSLFKKRVFIKPRPYMAPALEKNRETIAKIWSDSIRR